MKQKLKITAVLLLIVLVLGIFSVAEYERRRELVFAEVLDEVILTVDQRELKLSELAFYVAYQEQQIEAAARIYNPDNTNEYWSLHGNRMFLRDEGKQAVLDMAVHDEIFYQMAAAEGLELTPQEEEHIANDRYDFWSDLGKEERAALGISEEELLWSMRKIALAEKQQQLLAEIKQCSFEEYSLGGQAYERLLWEHEYTVAEDIWERVPFGSVTVDH